MTAVTHIIHIRDLISTHGRTDVEKRKAVLAAQHHAESLQE